MDRHEENNILGEAMEILIQQGTDGFADAMAIVMNEAMRLERQRWIKAKPYERTEQRLDYANGYKAKKHKTRIGELSLKVPQVRTSQFYPSSLEQGERSERALLLAVAEMYLQGVSTRKVAAITEKLCGFDISSSQVSRATARLDETLEIWRNRQLGCYQFIYLDARYEKVRHGGTVVDEAVLWATGVDNQGRRDVLGVSVQLSEAEVHWRTFLQSLVERGLHGVRLIISDDHAGLKAARKAVFPSVPWQRCQFHLQQNAAAYAPRKDMRSEIADSIRSIFGAPSREEADRLLRLTVEHYQDKAPRLAAWMSDNIPEGLTVFSFPSHQRRRLRTSNVMERCNKEIRRRTRVASIFPNEASCLRLVTAVLIEIAEEWQSQRKYIRMD